MQDAAVNKDTQRKDASHLQEYLLFCEGLGIRRSDALPAKDNVLNASMRGLPRTQGNWLGGWWEQNYWR
jgi:hypothetical protein